MKECELCGVRAWMYCEADHASLCWDCDEKVHGANFLVAKHPRILLCHVCQSMTPWTSCGTKLTPTVSVCQSCLVVQSHNNNKLGDDHLIDLNKQHERESEAENEEEEEEEEEEDYDGEEEDDDDVEDEEDENQVVPWSPPETSCSGNEAEISVSKRVRQNVPLDSSDDDEVGFDFDGTASFGGSLRPLKRTRLCDGEDSSSETEWGAASTIMSSMQRLDRKRKDLRRTPQFLDFANTGEAAGLN